MASAIGIHLTSFPLNPAIVWPEIPLYNKTIAAAPASFPKLASYADESPHLIK